MVNNRIVTERILLPRQTTIYTCGAACLAAVSRLMGGLDETNLARAMNARPVVGIDNDVLWNMAKTMGAENCGEDVWDGKQLAVLNILNPISGVGHYVVALRSDESGAAIAYCPYYATTLRLSKEWLATHWYSGDFVYHKWAITFPETLAGNLIGIGDEWPEMGLAAGEANPHWLLRSANRFLQNATVKLEAIA
ncbi:MAG: cysteine peptidase family C39 domain-containing protein [Acidithiobacillus sp.]